MAAPASTQRRLSSFDVNLLVALDALVQEVHVTRAARRIGLSQSAMSHALSRLRELLDDPILVRTGRGMTLTPRARQLAAPLASALAGLEGVLGPAAPVDPKELEGEVRIAAIDFAQLVLVPPLSVELSREAPGLGLVVLPVVEPLERGLADGSTDLAIGLSREAAGLHQERLMVERFVCVVRRKRPGRPRRIGARAYAKLPHALVSPRGRAVGAVDSAMRARGLERRVALTVPNALAAALAVARSDMVLTMAERVARIALHGLPLDTLEPPIAVEPFSVAMFWHPRQHADPRHAFVRERLLRLARRV